MHFVIVLSVVICSFSVGLYVKCVLSEREGSHLVRAHSIYGDIQCMEFARPTTHEYNP